MAAVALSYFGGHAPLELGRLYRGDGRGGFRDVAPQLGLTRLHLPMGSNFGDLDNDGWLDFYLGTGYPDYEALMPNVMYRNAGGAGFADVTWAGGFGHLQKGHGVAFADFDHDGDQDVFEQMGGALRRRSRVERRTTGTPASAATGSRSSSRARRSNRSAIGARIRRRRRRRGKRALDPPLGRPAAAASARARCASRSGWAPRRRSRRIEIYWPTSDTTQTFTAVAADRIYRVIEGEERSRS